MKNEEMKTNEKELILETPIGPISVDLGQFAAIQEQIEQERRAKYKRPSTLFEELRKEIVGKDFITTSKYWSGNLGQLVKVHTDAYFENEWELLSEVNIDEDRRIHIPCHYLTFPFPDGERSRFLAVGIRIYRHKNTGEKCMLSYGVDSDGDHRLTLWHKRKEKIESGSLPSKKHKTLLDDLVEDFYRHGPLKNRFFDLHYNFIETEDKSHELLCLDDDVRELLYENIIMFQDVMPMLKERGLPNSRGVILAGPPGTGKTLITKWLVNQSNITRILISAEMLTGRHNVKSCYEIARKLSPTLLIIEDIDTTGALNRRISDHPLLGEFLQAMDGVVPNDGVITVATTNHSESIDPAIADRPGRFDRIIEVGPPSLKQRVHILRRLLEKLDVDVAVSDESIATIAKGTEGLTGAWLREVVQSAMIRAISCGREHLTFTDLFKAMKDVLVRQGMAYRRPSYLEMESESSGIFG